MAAVCAEDFTNYEESIHILEQSVPAETAVVKSVSSDLEQPITAEFMKPTLMSRYSVHKVQGTDPQDLHGVQLKTSVKSSEALRQYRSNSELYFIHLMFLI